MLVVENEPHARVLVNPQNVRGAEAEVVMLQHQAPPHGLGQGLPRLHPARVALAPVAIRAAHMDHHDGFGPKPHQVEHFGLARQIPHAFADKNGVGAVEHHELRGVEGQADAERPRFRADCGEFRRAFAHHAVELGHVGMGRVGREVRRHAIHVDVVLREVVKNPVDMFERCFEMRVGLPTPRVVAFEVGPRHHLDGKAQAARRAHARASASSPWPILRRNCAQPVAFSAPPVACSCPLP